MHIPYEQSYRNQNGVCYLHIADGLRDPGHCFAQPGATNRHFSHNSNLAMALAGEAGEPLALLQWLTQDESRYMLWVMDKVDGAEGLIEEMELVE